MRIARANTKPLPEGPTAVELIDAGNLDVLQLDCQCPEPGEYAADFFPIFRSLHKFFYLDRSLRMITNAGGLHVVACTEAVGKYLREHDDGAMPITAVRGANLLPRLGELRAAGIEFADLETGESLLETPHRLQSAQVELGAGPLVTALDEGSRMVIAGCYDPVAAFVAAGVSYCDTPWDAYATLARLAVAAEVSAHSAMIAELNFSGSLFLEPAEKSTSRSTTLYDDLSALYSPGCLRSTDVTCDFSSLALEPREFGGFELRGVQGSKPTERWRVRFVTQQDDGQTLCRYGQVPREAVNISVDTRLASEWL